MILLESNNLQLASRLDSHPESCVTLAVDSHGRANHGSATSAVDVLAANWGRESESSPSGLSRGGTAWDLSAAPRRTVAADVQNAGS